MSGYEETRRAAIVAEAMTWIGTAWHHEARVKGAGVDCAQFLIGVYVECGLIEPFTTDHYPQDWHLHNDAPRFLRYLLDYCKPTDTPKPGDVAMFKYGRQAAHGAILIDDRAMIHAYRNAGAVVVSDRDAFADRLAGYYTWKGF